MYFVPPTNFPCHFQNFLWNRSDQAPLGALLTLTVTSSALKDTHISIIHLIRSESRKYIGWSIFSHCHCWDLHEHVKIASFWRWSIVHFNNWILLIEMDIGQEEEVCESNLNRIRVALTLSADTLWIECSWCDDHQMMWEKSKQDHSVIIIIQSRCKWCLVSHMPGWSCIANINITTITIIIIAIIRHCLKYSLRILQIQTQIQIQIQHTDTNTNANTNTADV